MIRFLSNLTTNYYIRFFLFLLIISSHSYSISEPKIKEKINLLHNGLIALSERGINKESFDFIHEIIKDTYDCKKMSRMVVGKIWKNTDLIEREKFTKVFEEFVATNYLKRFGNMIDFNFEFKKIEKIGDNFRLVKVFLIHKNKEIQINYLMHQIEREWKIFDVLYDGSISEIATKKSEFSNIIKDQGIKKLTSFIQEKNKF